MSWFPARRLVRAFLFLFLLTSTAPLIGQGAKVKTPGKWIEEPDEQEATEQKIIRERQKWFMKGRQAPKGETPAGMRIKAFHQKQVLRLANQKRFAANSAVSTTNGVANQANSGGGLPTSTPAFNQLWTPLGPTPIGRFNSGYGDVTGRVTAIAVDQTDSSGNTVYVGGAYGGVWKSTNAGNALTDNITWTPLTDSEASLAANAIAISPANNQIILVGTGEPDFAGDSYYGTGILRSTDGGASWTLISHDQGGTHAFKGMGVSKFAWSTANPNLVVAGFSNGSVIEFGSNIGNNQGIYYSTNAGSTWNKAVNNNPGDGVFGSTSDVIYNSTANKFFAALRGQGIYQSSDGINWTRLANQPFGFSATCSNNQGCDLLRASLASYPGKNEIYVVGIDNITGTTLKGVARSVNGGAWTALTTTGIINCGDPENGGCGAGQGFYDLVLAAVPNGTNTDLYVGMVNLYRCSNAATTTCTFTNVTHVYGSNPLGMHPDYHSFDFLHSSPTKLFIGNDGGLYRSLNGLVGSGVSAAQNLNAHLGSFSQFVSMSQHPTDSNVLLGGLQDNGSPSRDSSHFNDMPGSNEQTWVHIAGGDGGYNAINQASPNLWSQSYVYITIGQCDSSQPNGNDPNGTTGGCIPNALPAAVVSANGSQYLSGPNNPVPQNIPDEGQFYTTFILDPANQSKLIIGTCRVWRGNANGSGWSAASFANALSNQLSSGATSACNGVEPAVKSLSAGGPVVGGLSSVIYAGLDNGEMFATTNSTGGPGTWVNRPGPWGGSPVADIAILGGNTGNGLTAFVVTQNFGVHHVWKTINAGASWADINNNLPDAPTNSIAIDPGDVSGNTLYVGTDLGVFYTTDGGANWVEYGPASGAGAFPNSPVTRLLTFSSGGQNLLRASTYGRGVWQNVLATSLTPDYSIAVSDSPQSVYPGITATFHGTVSFLNGYAGTVNLSCAPTGGAPDGGCSVTPPSVSAAGAFTVDVSSSVATDFVINVHGDDGTIQHNAPFTLHVIDFLLGAPTPNLVSIPRGTSGNLDFQTSAIGSFNDNITVTCDTTTPLPAGVTCSTDVNPPGLDGITIHTLGTTPLGSFGLTLKANAPGSPTKTQSFTLTTTANPDFELDTQPNPDIVLPGGSVNLTVDTTAQDGYTSSNIGLTCPGANVGPLAGVTCNFNPNPTTEAGESILTISATGATTATDKALSVMASDNNGHVHQSGLTLKVQNFTTSATPTTLQTVSNGNSQNYIANFAAVNGFNQSITVGCANLAAGMSCNAVPPTVTPGTSSTVTLSTTNGSTPLATTTLQITGMALGVTRSSANLQLKTTDFQVTSTTPSASANAGSNGTIGVNVKALNGYAKPVALSCSNLPANVGCTFSTNNFTPSSTGTAVTVTLTTTTAVPFGVYNTISLNALGDTQTHFVTLTLTVKDFHHSLNPNTMTLGLPPAGQNSTSTTTVTFFADQGFNSAVTPSCLAPLPTGVTCAFLPTTVTPTLAGANTTLTVTANSTAPSATNPLNIKGAAGVLTHQQPLSLTTGAPNFTQAVTPATQNVVAGSSVDYTVVYTPLGGMNQPITVGCGALLPAGVTCTPTPPTVTPGTTPGNQSIVTLGTTFATTPAANAIVAITGNGVGIMRSNNVTLSVKNFTVTANTATVSTNVGTNIADNIVVKGLNGFTGNVALGCVIVGTPTDTACNLSNVNPVASAAGTSVTATIVSNAVTTPAGSYTVQVTGTAAGGPKMAQFTINIKDFTLATGMGAITIPQPPAGQSSSVTVPVTLTAISGYNTSTALSCTGQPVGITCAFLPASGIPTIAGLHSTLTVTSTSAVLPNTYHLQVKAAAGTLIRLQSLDVTDYGPNFTQAVAPATQNVTAGSSAQYTVTYTPLGGMNQDITVSCGTLPLGVTCTPLPAVVNPGNGYQSTVTLQTDFATTPAANSTVAIMGNGIGITRSNNVTLSVKNFTVTANTATVSTNVGANITDTIVVKGLNGFTGNVALGCVILGTPTGTNCTLSSANPAATAAGTSVTATIVSNAVTTPAGSYTVQVTGTTAGGPKMAQFTVNIKDFTLATGMGAITIPQPPAGQSSSVMVPVTLTALNAYNTSTALSCTGQPVGITCAFSPASGIPTIAGLHSTLTVTSTSAVLPNTYHLQVKAAAGTLIRLQSLDVTDYGPNFTAVVTPTIQNVAAGGATAYTVTFTPLGGMLDPITVDCATLQAGVTCTPNPSTVIPGTTPGNQSVVTLQTTFGTTPAANATVAISGVSSALNNLTRSTNVTLSVKDFTVTANTATVATNVGTNITDTIVVKGVNGFTGNVALACVIVGTPTGTACNLSNPNPAATSTGTSVTATIVSNAATTPTGTYTVQVTGTTSGGSKPAASITLNIKDFAITVNPGLVALSLPSSGTTSRGTTTATLTSINGFNSSTSLGCAGLPAGMTCAFSPSSAIPTASGSNSTLTVSITSSVVLGDYNISVKGTTGSLVRLTTLQVSVTPHISPPSPSRSNFVRIDDFASNGVYDSAHNVFFASDGFQNEVVAIDVAKAKISARIPIPDPTGAAVIGNRLYVGSPSDYLSVVDTDKLQVVQRIPLHQSYPMAMYDGTIYMLSGEGTFRWNPVNGNRTPAPDGGGGVALPSGDKHHVLWACCFFSSSTSLSLYDADSNTISASANFPVNNSSAAAVNFDGTRTAVCMYDGSNSLEAVIHIFDSSLNQIGSVQTADFCQSLHFSSDSTKLFVSEGLAPPGIVTAIRMQDLTVVGSLSDIDANGAINTVTQFLDNDSTGLLFGPVYNGIAILDTTHLANVPHPLPSMGFATPLSGPSGVSTATQIAVVNPPGTPIAYFGDLMSPTSSISGTNVNATAPASTSGPVDLRLFYPSGWADVWPEGFSYGVSSAYQVGNAGPATGGGKVTLCGFGFPPTSAAVSITVNGQNGTVLGTGAADNCYRYDPMGRLDLQVPAGNVGSATIQIHTPAGVGTAPYHYLSTTTVPNAAPLHEGVMDAQRQRIYYAAGPSIQVFSTSLNQFLAPIPVNASNADLMGITLTPDGNKILATDHANDLLHVINANDQTEIAAVPVLDPNSPYGPNHPARVAATSTGHAFVTLDFFGSGCVMAFLRDVDLGTLMAGPAPPSEPDSGTSCVDGHAQMVASPTGDFVYINTDGGLITWNSATNTTVGIGVDCCGAPDIAASNDGVFLSGYFFGRGATNYIGHLKVLDAEYWYGPDRIVNGMKLHPSSSLLYMPSVQGAYIFDTNTLRTRMILDSGQSVVDAFDPLVIDPSGRNLYLITTNGLTLVQLDAVPLGFGSIQPGSGTAGGGTTVTISGSGFDPSTTVSFDDVQASVTFVDSNTLTVTTPLHTPGTSSLILRNSDGQVYTRQDAYLFSSSAASVNSPRQSLWTRQAAALNHDGVPRHEAGLSPREQQHDFGDFARRAEDALAKRRTAYKNQVKQTLIGPNRTR